MAEQYFVPGFGIVDATKQYFAPGFGNVNQSILVSRLTPSGGIVLGGHVTSNNSFDFTTQIPAGGFVLGGAPTPTGFHFNIKTVVPTGGIVLGGSSPISTAPGWEIIIPSGGIVFGGSAPFCGYTDQGKLLVEITLNGIINRVSTEGHALTHNWRPRIINIGGPTYSIPSDHGGFAKMVFGNLTFNPELFRDYWPPPISCHIEFYYTDTTEEARELIFKGTAHIYSYDRVGITYAIYGPIYDDLVPDSTVYNGSLNDTIASILTLIPEITEVNTLLARNPSPTVSYTSTGDNVLAINLASEIAEFFTHLFYIVGTTAYLVDMGTDNGTKDLTNEFKFLAYPKYKHKSPIAVLSAGEFSQSSDYPYGSESSVTPYTDVQADIETALANIIEIENAPRINFDAPMIHRNFLLHGQRVSLFDSANVVDLYSWMRVRKIQYDFNQWKINFEGEGAILSGDEYNPFEAPFCIKKVAETEALPSNPQVTPIYKIVYQNNKVYALAHDAGTGNAHGYIIDAITMEILSTVDYGAAVDYFSNYINWSDDLERFLIVGVRGALTYLYELDDQLAIRDKVFYGTCVTGTDTQLYGRKGVDFGWNEALMKPLTGSGWASWMALIDADARAVDNAAAGNSWAGWGDNPSINYSGGRYIVCRATGGYFDWNYLVDRTTLHKIKGFDPASHHGVLYGGMVYAVRGGYFQEIDPTTNPPNNPVTRSLAIPSSYPGRPYIYDGKAFIAYPTGFAQGRIVKIDLDSFTIDAYWDSVYGATLEPRDSVIGADGLLYVSNYNGFVVLDPADMSFICQKDFGFMLGTQGIVSDGTKYLYGTNSGKIQKYVPGTLAGVEL